VYKIFAVIISWYCLDEGVYRIFAVIIHRGGSLDGGHYYTWARERGKIFTIQCLLYNSYTANNHCFEFNINS
jgi:uncharacterized UBP type Zn finger protein